MHGLFITSVGTGVGKTLVTTILCHQLTRAGERVVALKPVVSGYAADDPDSDPALILRSLGKQVTPQAIAAIAPWRFGLPLSPHLAAREEGQQVAFGDVLAFCREQDQSAGDYLLIEGAGGVMSPIDDTHTCLDLIVGVGHPAVLVTGSYLGAISHTLTAVCALRSRDACVRGVIVSESEAGVKLSDTVESLRLFAGYDLPVYALPRIRTDFEPKWRAICPLSDLCDLDAE